jgi:hypothetical protein
MVITSVEEQRRSNTTCAKPPCLLEYQSEWNVASEYRTNLPTTTSSGTTSACNAAQLSTTRAPGSSVRAAYGTTTMATTAWPIYRTTTATDDAISAAATNATNATNATSSASTAAAANYAAPWSSSSYPTAGTNATTASNPNSATGIRYESGCTVKNQPYPCTAAAAFSFKKQQCSE